MTVAFDEMYSQKYHLVRRCSLVQQENGYRRDDKEYTIMSL